MGFSYFLHRDTFVYIIFYFTSVLLSFVFHFGYLLTFFYFVIPHFPLLHLSSLNTHFKHSCFVVFLTMSCPLFILFFCFILSLLHIITFQKAVFLSSFFGDVDEPAVWPVFCGVTEALWEGCDIYDRI